MPTMSWTNSGGARWVYLEMESHGFITGLYSYDVRVWVTGPQEDDAACAELQDAEFYGSNPALRHPCPCQSTLADPVDVRTGNLHMPMPGLFVPGRGPGLSFDLGYNSLNAGIAGSTGNGWSNTFDMNFGVRPDGSAYVTQEHGSEIRFLPGAGGVWVPLERNVATLSPGSPGTVVFTRNHFDRFVFDTTTGRLISASDQFGNETTYSYSAISGKLEAVTDAANRSLDVVWSGDHIIEVADEFSGPGGPRTLEFSYDLDGNLVGYVDGDGGQWEMTYDLDGRMLTMKKPRHSDPSKVIENSYDSVGRVLWQEDELDRRTSFAYDSPSVGMTTSTLPDGTFQVDEFVDGRREATTTAAGTPDESTVRYTYDRATLALTSVTTNDGAITKFTNDLRGNRLSTHDPSGRITRWTYNNFDQVTSFKTGETGAPLTPSTANVVTDTMTYDAVDGRLMETVEATGTPIAATTTYAYDLVHPEDLVTVTDARSNVWTTTYDEATGLMTSRSDPLGNTDSWTYNDVGWVTSRTSPRGNATPAPGDFVTGFGYDRLARTTSIVSPDGVSSRTSFDANGNMVEHATGITSMDPIGDVTTYTYTNADEIESVIHPDASSSSFTYLSNGKVGTTTNENGDEWVNTYDYLGRLTTTTDPSGGVIAYSYDAAGRIQHVVQPGLGNTCEGIAVGCVTNSYDLAGRLIGMEYSDPATANVTSITYDPHGRRVAATLGTTTETWTWDARNRLVNETDANGRTFAYGYDAVSNLTSITYPGEPTPIVREFDAANRLVNVTDFDLNETSFSYDENGNLVTTLFPSSTGNVDHYSYDESDRMTAVGWFDSAGSLGGETYTHTHKGFVGSIDPTGAAGSGLSSYTYDARDRLTNAAGQPYSYDSASNQTSGSGLLKVYDEVHRLCWTSPTATTGECDTPAVDATEFTFDARGNRLSTIDPVNGIQQNTWNQLNQLVGYSDGVDSWSYDYSVDGLRVEKLDPLAGSSEFSWSTQSVVPQLLGVHDGAGDTWLIYGPGGRAIEQVNADGSLVWLHQDRMGSVRLGTDELGAVVSSSSWDAHGRMTATSGTADVLLGFVGEWTDEESGYVYLRARYYDPVTDVFLSFDPLFTVTRDAYGYASNNPMNLIDPLGLFSLSGVVDWASEKVNEAVQYVKENPGIAATGVSAVVCVAGGIVACGIGAAIAFAVRTNDAITDCGWDKSKGSIIADAALTTMTFGLVTAPAHYGLLRTAANRGAHGVLTGAQRGIMHDAGWKSTLFAKASFVAPDVAGLTGHELARRRDPHAC